MATPKPTVLPRFASVDMNNGTGSAPNVSEPSSGKKDSGWNEGERPAREFFNWIHRITHDWIEYLDCEMIRTNAGRWFSQDTAATTGLTFVIGPGRAVVRGRALSAVVLDSDASFSLTGSVVNFLYFNLTTESYASASAATLGAIPEYATGAKNILPLYAVTTDVSAITAILDLRTWATYPSLSQSELAVHERRTAGHTQEPVTFGATDSTPDPDMAISNIFVIRPNATPVGITIQNALNPEVLAATNSQEVHFIIELNNSAQSIAWSAGYVFVDDPAAGGSGNVIGTDGLTYYAHGTWDPTGNRFLMTIAGGDRRWADQDLPAAGDSIAMAQVESAGQATTTGVAVKLQLDASIYAGTGLTVDLANDRLINNTGKSLVFEIDLSLSWKLITTADLDFWIERNGIQISETHPGNHNDPSTEVASIKYVATLNNTQYVEVWWSPSSAATMTPQPASTLSIRRV